MATATVAKRPRPKRTWDGDVLRALRTRAKLTQAELADLTGLYAPEISNYERGVSEPSFSVLVKIAAALGADLNAFAPTPPRGE